MTVEEMVHRCVEARAPAHLREDRRWNANQRAAFVRNRKNASRSMGKNAPLGRACE